jgi:hypothetical protein
MNGAFQGPSAAEDLPRIPNRGSTGEIQEEGVASEVEVYPAASPT